MLILDCQFSHVDVMLQVESYPANFPRSFYERVKTPSATDYYLGRLHLTISKPARSSTDARPSDNVEAASGVPEVR